MKPVPPPRLALLLARRAPVAVIFRRGPSKHVELVRWELDRDTFERGHWFHGRIYARRSHLSPDAEHLVYFAAKFKTGGADDPKPHYSWTAVSRPPWLTAIALWPKRDCWWGGGLFLDNRTLWLNHLPAESEPDPKHRPPKSLVVEANPDAHGENEPIYRRRLELDGWTLRKEWAAEWQGYPKGYRTTVPDERVKYQTKGAEGGLAVVLSRRIDNLKYREHFRVEGASAAPELPPGPLEWLDFDHRGRVVALSGGRVWVADVEARRIGRFRELLDLRSDAFEQRVSPEGARRW